MTWRRRNWLVMAGFTGGAPDGQVTSPGNHSLAYLAKVGYDTTTPRGTRLRLTGSMYTVGQATANALYSGDRAGSHYFDVMENTASTERANAWSGNVQPGFTHHVTAFVLNPLVKYADLELFGNFETATGGATAGGPDRTWRQQSVDAVYRVLDDFAYVAARYNTAAGTIVGAPRDVEVHRVQLGMGLFITRNFLAKLELVRQTHQGYPGDHILNGGRFSGVMLEGAVKF